MSLTRIKRGAPETWVFDYDIDITGYTIILNIKEDKTDSDLDALYTKTITSHSDPANGTTSFEQTAAETEAMKNGVYWFAVKAFDSDGASVHETNFAQVEYLQNIVQTLNV